MPCWTRCRAKRIIAIEPHPGVATLFLSCRDWRRWFADGRLRLLTGPDYKGAADLARFLDGLREISIVAHPLRARWEPEAVARASAVAQRMVQNAKSNGNARRRFAGPYLLQTLSDHGDWPRGGSPGARSAVRRQTGRRRWCRAVTGRERARSRCASGSRRDRCRRYGAGAVALGRRLAARRCRRRFERAQRPAPHDTNRDRARVARRRRQRASLGLRPVCRPHVHVPRRRSRAVALVATASRGTPS